MPDAVVIVLLVNPKNPESEQQRRDAQEAARPLGLELLPVNASTPGEITAAFASASQRHASALLVSSDPFFTARRQQIVALAARNALPAMYFNREFVVAGGLMSYGNDLSYAYRRAGIYTGRILNGASPSDMPVDQATRFAFVINLRTAKALGLDVPAGLSASADEIIE